MQLRRPPGETTQSTSGMKRCSMTGASALVPNNITPRSRAFRLRRMSIPESPSVVPRSSSVKLPTAYRRPSRLANVGCPRRPTRTTKHGRQTTGRCMWDFRMIRFAVPTTTAAIHRMSRSPTPMTRSRSTAFRTLTRPKLANCLAGSTPGDVFFRGAMAPRMLIAFDIDPEMFRQMGDRRDGGVVKVFSRRP